MLDRPQAAIEPHRSGFANSGGSVLHARLAEFHHRAGIFSLLFQGLVAAGMPSCRPKDRTACANRTEYRGRVLRGSDRSADSRPGPNCCFGQIIRKPQNNDGRSSQAPGERPNMFDLRPAGRQPGGSINIEIVRGRCQKITHLRSCLGSSKFSAGANRPASRAEFACGVAATLGRFHSGIY
jgi:hypothetical protein